MKTQAVSWIRSGKRTGKEEKKEGKKKKEKKKKEKERKKKGEGMVGHGWPAAWPATPG